MTGRDGRRGRPQKLPNDRVFPGGLRVLLDSGRIQSTFGKGVFAQVPVLQADEDMPEFASSFGAFSI